MIFNRDVLFVHAPKTGGLSTTRHLLGVLPRPVYLSHPIRDPTLPLAEVVQIDGKRHETLAEARAVVARHGFALDRFPLILATIRNPYDLEVSRWAYLRRGLHWERGPEQDLALRHDFEEFAGRNDQRGGCWETEALAAYAGRPGELRDFSTLDGRVPANLRLLRFENLAEEVADALRGVGIAAAADFPWDNRSERDDYPAHYTPRAEAAVYHRYRWVFDQGFYPRLEL